MATIEIDIENYLDEVETHHLVSELKSRMKNAKKYKDKDPNILTNFLEEVLDELDESDFTHYLTSTKLNIVQADKLREFIKKLTA